MGLLGGRDVPLVPNLVRSDAPPKVDDNFIAGSNLNRIRQWEEHREPRTQPPGVVERMNADGDILVQNAVEIPGESMHNAIQLGFETDRFEAGIVDDRIPVGMDKFEQCLRIIDVVGVLQIGHIGTFHVAGRDNPVFAVWTLFKRTNLVVDLRCHTRVQIGCRFAWKKSSIKVIDVGSAFKAGP